MITRRQGREWAVQALVQFDLNPPPDIDDAISALWGQLAALEMEQLDGETFGVIKTFTVSRRHDIAALAAMKEFAETRMRGAWADRAKLDAALDPYLDHWKLYRIGTVERAVLRLAAWEMQNCPDISPAIVMNEAVDLVKYFAESKSARFVNGVLNSFAKSLRPKPPEPSSTPKSPKPPKSPKSPKSPKPPKPSNHQTIKPSNQS